MNQLKINKDQVSHIRIYDIKKSKYFYKPEKTKKYLFGLFKKANLEGYYSTSFERYFLVFTMKEVYNSVHFRNIDGILWYNPYIEIFAGKDMVPKCFKTVEEAKEYVTINFPNVNVVI